MEMEVQIPEPSPNTAPLKKTKVAQCSPLKPVQLSFAAEEPAASSSGSDNNGPSEDVFRDTLVDVYLEVPEFGDESASQPYTAEPCDADIKSMLEEASYARLCSGWL